MPTPVEFTIRLAKELYGMTKEEAAANEVGLCISCKNPALANCYSAAGRKEVAISGLCEICFDKMFE